MILLPSNKTHRDGLRKSYCNGVLRKIFEDKRKEVTGDWRLEKIA
jgi:hypothetical protein